MKVYTIYKDDRERFIQDFNTFVDTHDDGYLLVLAPEDTFRDGRKGAEEVRIFGDYLAGELDMNPDAVLATPKKLFQFPDRMSGCMFRISMLKNAKDPVTGEELKLNDRYIYSYEADYLIRLTMEHQFLIQRDIEYVQGDVGDGNYREFVGAYDKDWYLREMREFLIPMLEELNSADRLTYMIQMFTLYHIKCRLDANQNNRNCHALTEEEIEQYKEYVAQALTFIDDHCIMNIYRYPVYKRDYQFCRMLLRLKYGDNLPECITYERIDEYSERIDEYSEWIDYHYLTDIRYPALAVMVNGKPTYTSSRLRCNIQLMDNRDGILRIDGSVPDIYDKEIVSYYFRLGDRKYSVHFCERYSLTKFFGVSAYKRYPFHVDIDLSAEKTETESMSDRLEADIKSNELGFYMNYEGKEYRIAYEFKSHTSRLAAYPRNSYWHVGKYLITPVHHRYNNSLITDGIRIEAYNWFKMAAKELGIGRELLFSFRMHRFRFFLLRAAWVITAPYFRRKNIWMFFDKIYKGGDSSEYLYRYAHDRGKKDIYYLIDKSTPDYKRLKDMGLHPLKRGSFLHRLIFLNAKMMIVSNSTVFAFNDYYLENSRYIRGIPDFSVVCVQHGLSVQKIALAQQRLRDNTRLYYCASKYEIENLSRPVYDYEGYDALRLTGVPRYDGLVDERKKQIMISPTWRMQSAIQVTKNEGVERGYNPEFIHTPYYKVYNALINDKHLIAAAEKYGYRIKYVLHPIVSPQADDFDKNDYVDIVPSVGDMSYEKLFRESSLMVTDYSGIQFDFAYMRKPLVYFQPDELEAHYEEGSFHYDTMAFGEIVRKRDELVKLLIEYMKDGCEMKELYRMRADDFFEYSDRNNCERIYEDIMKYQASSMNY